MSEERERVCVCVRGASASYSRVIHDSRFVITAMKADSRQAALHVDLLVVVLPLSLSLTPNTIHSFHLPLPSLPLSLSSHSLWITTSRYDLLLTPRTVPEASATSALVHSLSAFIYRIPSHLSDRWPLKRSSRSLWFIFFLSIVSPHT